MTPLFQGRHDGPGNEREPVLTATPPQRRASCRAPQSGIVPPHSKNHFGQTLISPFTGVSKGPGKGLSASRFLPK